MVCFQLEVLRYVYVHVIQGYQEYLTLQAMPACEISLMLCLISLNMMWFADEMHTYKLM